MNPFFFQKRKRRKKKRLCENLLRCLIDLLIINDGHYVNSFPCSFAGCEIAGQEDSDRCDQEDGHNEEEFQKTSASPSVMEEASSESYLQVNLMVN